MGKLSLSKMVCIVFVFCAATAIASLAQTFTTLATFNGYNGANPTSSLVQGADGSFYGTTTQLGGANGGGTVFKITSGGTLTTLYGFCSQTSCADGGVPQGGLVQATNGNFYGTNLAGGHFGCGGAGCGTAFEMTPAGTLTTLYTFCSRRYCKDGAEPWAGLIQATDGSFYGTTQGGGANRYGTVYKITAGGKLTTLYNFCAQTNCADGANPDGGLVQATDGNFYGTTYSGGDSNYGTVFKITPAGKLTTLKRFCTTNCGGAPSSGLVQATNGDFYGTTHGGDGTVFTITPGGKLTTLHSFDKSDGDEPWAGLIQATDGNFYGTTYFGGANNYGTVFKITAGGILTTLHSFDETGNLPWGGLLQATDGSFYGTTSSGPGSSSYGTVFNLSVGLGPFVETNPTSGNVGTKVIILGTDLTGATSVSFHRTAAKFKVVSKSEIKTTVPAGATTGKVEVKTPKGTLKSNVVFRVTK